MVEEVVGGGLTIGTGDDDLVLTALIQHLQDIGVDGHGHFTGHGTGTAFKDFPEEKRCNFTSSNCKIISEF